MTDLIDRLSLPGALGDLARIQILLFALLLVVLLLLVRPRCKK